MTNYFSVGISFIFYGILILSNNFRITHLEQEEVLSLVFIVYGLTAFIKSFDKLKRGGLFLTATILNLGIIFFILTHYEILDWYNVVTPSVFYIIGAGLIVLFIENTSEKVFAFSGVFFLSLSFLTVVFVDHLGVINIIESITLILFDYWPLFLILFGVMMLTRRNSSDLSSSSSSTVVKTSE